MNHSPVGAGSSLELYLSLLMFVSAVLVPFCTIVFCVLRSPSATRGEKAELGLGDVSLHDEMWNFIDKVERGDVTLRSLEAESRCDEVSEHGGSKNSYLP